MPACRQINLLSTLKDLISSWLSRRWCKRRELESVIGHLHHTAKVVWPGRTFLHRMIDLLCCFRKTIQFALIGSFTLTCSGGTSSCRSGMGSAFGCFQAFSLKLTWKSHLMQPDQWAMELFPVVVAAHVWGHQWCRKHVLFRSDNDAVVHILNSRTSKVPCLMRLIRSLLFAAACHCFSFSAQHIPGVTNQIADALSRFRWQEFRQLAPHAQLHPTSISHDLLTDLTSPV